MDSSGSQDSSSTQTIFHFSLLIQVYTSARLKARHSTLTEALTKVRSLESIRIDPGFPQRAVCFLHPSRAPCSWSLCPRCCFDTSKAYHQHISCWSCLVHCDNVVFPVCFVLVLFALFEFFCGPLVLLFLFVFGDCIALGLLRRPVFACLFFFDFFGPKK